MTNKRSEIYKYFKHYAKEKDTRSMDEICSASPTQEFALITQQLFLRDYMKKYPNWSKLLLYHEIGSGKTCTAITMAEQYKEQHPNNKVKVILPARLKTNFIDELISPCGMERYISKEDFEMYSSSNTSASARARIKKKFNTAISQVYEIMSFERLKITAIQHKADIFSWINAFTKDSLIIVDEAHNLLSDKYIVTDLKNIQDTGTFDKIPTGFNTILFNLLAQKAHNSSKFILLTATPVFDNIHQLKELVRVMNNYRLDFKKPLIKNLIELLRGKVSYFPGVSANAYPAVEYETHNIPMSATQSDLTMKILDAGNIDEFAEQYLAKQRQVAIACLPNSTKISNRIDEVLSNMNEYCPKVKLLLDFFKQNIGKHLVYCTFIKSGLNVVDQALRKDGWISIHEAIKDPLLWSLNKFKVFARWDGSVNDSDKQLIKNVVNSKDNIDGIKVRANHFLQSIYHFYKLLSIQTFFSSDLSFSIIFE
jgi:hypothetical protein